MAQVEKLVADDDNGIPKNSDISYHRRALIHLSLAKKAEVNTKRKLEHIANCQITLKHRLRDERLPRKAKDTAHILAFQVTSLALQLKAATIK